MDEIIEFGNSRTPIHVPDLEFPREVALINRFRIAPEVASLVDTSNRVRITWGRKFAERIPKDKGRHSFNL